MRPEAKGFDSCARISPIPGIRAALAVNILMEVKEVNTPLAITANPVGLGVAPLGKSLEKPVRSPTGGVEDPAIGSLLAPLPCMLNINVGALDQVTVGLIGQINTGIGVKGRSQITTFRGYPP